MSAPKRTSRSLKPSWRVFSLHVTFSLCFAVLVTAAQLVIHPLVTGDSAQDWLFIATHSAGLDGLFLYREPLEHQWALDDLNALSGISNNRLVMVKGAFVKQKKSFRIAGRPWEISIRWEEGCQRRPYRLFHGGYKNLLFTLLFSEADRGHHLLKLDSDDPAGCGLFFRSGNQWEVIGECSPSCREAIRKGSHTLTLKGEGDSVSALIDGSPCAHGAVDELIEELRVALAPKANSCVAFDDLAVRFKEDGSGWSEPFEESFEAAPLQTGWPDARFDLDSRVSRITITWAALAAALLIDLVTLILFGRRSPYQALCVIAVPQALAILSLQNLLFLPLVPLLCSLCTIWTSKMLLSFLGRPQELQQRAHGILWVYGVLTGVAFLFAAVLAGKLKLGSGPEIALVASVCLAALAMLLLRQWSREGLKTSLLFWFALCELQALHWLWFRRVWIFLGHETVVIASILPAIMVIGLYIGAIERSGWVRVFGKLLTAALLVLCIELTIRSIPIQCLLDFDWRTGKSFWNLQKHTELMVDHSREEIFEDSVGRVYSRKKPEGVFRIVCLGSSSTEGSGATQNTPLESYPSQLGFLLQRCSPGAYEVINTGVCGYRLTQLRIYFEQVISDLDPDLLILYFGWNGDASSDLKFYRRIEALLKTHPNLIYPAEVEAALSLRWPHPALIQAYLFLARSRLFMGMKLLAEQLKPERNEKWGKSQDETFYRESADHLVSAALKQGAEVLLIPEIVSQIYKSDFESVFEALMPLYDSEPVHLLRVEEFDTASYLVDEVHMTAAGYAELSRIIANYLVEAGLIRCDPGSISPGYLEELVDDVD